MERTEQLLALIAEGIATRNMMTLEYLATNSVDKQEYLKEIQEQSNILTLIEKEAKEQWKRN